MSKKYYLGQLFRQYGEQFIKQYRPDLMQIKAIRSIRICRTPTLGGKLLHCSSCGHFNFIFKSCGNRNCPLCQNIKKEVWLDKVVQLELPVTHFHTVFTLPHELNDLVRSNQRLCYGILFKAASKAMKDLCAEKLNFTSWHVDRASYLGTEPFLPSAYTLFDTQRWCRPDDQ